MCTPKIFPRKKCTPKQSTSCALRNRTIFFARRPELHLCTMWVLTSGFAPPKKSEVPTQLKQDVLTNSVHLHVCIRILYIHTNTHTFYGSGALIDEHWDRRYSTSADDLEIEEHLCLQVLNTVPKLLVVHNDLVCPVVDACTAHVPKHEIGCRLTHNQYKNKLSGNNQ